MTSDAMRLENGLAWVAKEAHAHPENISSMVEARHIAEETTKGAIIAWQVVLIIALSTLTRCMRRTSICFRYRESGKGIEYRENRGSSSCWSKDKGLLAAVLRISQHGSVGVNSIWMQNHFYSAA